MTAGQRRLFDSHCHIIDHRFPIVANQGYVPPAFPLEAYLAEAGCRSAMSTSRATVCRSFRTLR